MATVSKWNPFGVALDITATSSTVTRTSSTKCTVKLNVSWKATWDGAQTDYGMDVTSGGVTKTINTANGTKRSSGSGSFTGTYTVTANNAVTVPIAVVFKSYSWNGTKSATKTITLNVSVPAWTSYNVTYNANGGSGAPSTQKKWKGQSLTLSSTVPTRTGYTFKGWSTSSGSTTVAYKPSYVYVSEAPLTLYAVWELITYKIEYSANGGSGAPATQTKKYGVALKLSSTIPTREKYNFKGWGISASSTVVKYPAGGNYTANAAIKLFAIWELAYTKPKISNLTVTRYSDGSPTGEPSDSGTYAYVSFDWSTFQLPATITVTQSPGNISYSTEYTEALTQNYRRGWGNLNPDTTYMFTITVSDGDGRDYSTTLTRTLPGTKFVIDFRNGGTGVAIGKSAELEGVLDIAHETHFREPVYVENQKAFYGYDPEGNLVEFMNPVNENGNIVLGYGNYDRKLGNTNVYGNDVHIGVSSITTPGYYRPYRRMGDTITLSLKTAGYVTNGGKDVSFTVPLAVPIIGSPNVSASSVDGFALRQGSKYTHGSSASVCVSPDSYTATIHYDAMWVGVTIVASFTDTTNVTNNDAIGIYWSGTITFS